MIRLVPFADLTDDIRIDEVHSSPTIALPAHEIPVVPHIGHRRQYRRQRSAFRTLERRPQDFAVFLLGATITLCRAALQRKDQICRQVSNDQLCHDGKP
jgi:hypothetical protein